MSIHSAKEAIRGSMAGESKRPETRRGGSSSEIRMSVIIIASRSRKVAEETTGGPQGEERAGERKLRAGWTGFRVSFKRAFLS